MAGSGASLNWGGIDRALGRLANRLSNKRQLLEACGEALLAGTLQRFQDEEAPDGTPWEGIRRSGKILTNTAHLRNSIDTATTENSVLVGTNLIYANVHQFGATIKPKNAKVLKFKGSDGSWKFAKKVTVPARPYLGISADDWEEVKATINEFLADSLRG